MSSRFSLKQAPYGYADFMGIRQKGLAFIDKTRYIETLENCGSLFPFIVRPRRFGKTLFTNILQAYYDKAAAKDFDLAFQGTYIGTHRTELASQYYVIRFNFSSISVCNFLTGFIRQIKEGLADFCDRYHFTEAYSLFDKSYSDPVDLLSDFLVKFNRNFDGKIFLIVDEYDQGANEVLSSNLQQFKQLTSTGGVLKTFYSYLKYKSEGGPIGRIFLTGVTSISLDSMTSGFSIAKNISSYPVIATMYGFTEDELRQLILQMVDLTTYKKSSDEIVSRMHELYNGYRFSPVASESVFNASICLYYLSYIQDFGEEPDQFIDPAVAHDLSKIHGILRLGRKADVEEIVDLAVRHKRIPFGQLPDILNLQSDGRLSKKGLLSTLIYLGYLTYAPGENKELIVPNRAMALQFFDVYFKFLRHFSKWEMTSRSAYAPALKSLAAGNARPLVETVARVLNEASGIHSAAHLSESDFQSGLLVAGYLASGYDIATEVEVRGKDKGYIDLLFTSTTGGLSFLFELKYLSKSKGSDSAVEQAIAQAQKQAAQYVQGDNIKHIPNLQKVCVVFVGAEVKAYSSE